MVVEKRRSNGWQAFGSYTLSRAVRTAGVERGAPPPARRSAPCRPPGSLTDVRTRSERSHQRLRPAAERSAAHVPGDGQLSTCRAPGSWSPPICSTSPASPGRPRRRCLCRRATSASCSSRAAAPAVVADAARRARVEDVPARGVGRGRAAARSAQRCSTTRPRRAWRPTTVRARTSGSRRLRGSAARDVRREDEPRPIVTHFSRALLPRQLEQHDVRVLARTIEDDELAIGRDVEARQRSEVAEACQRPRLLRLQIEEREVLRRLRRDAPRPAPSGRKRQAPGRALKGDRSTRDRPGRTAKVDLGSESVPVHDQLAVR